MTNAELLAKIKAVIERRRKSLDYNDPYSKRACRQLDTLLSFLDTLESEKPMSQDGLEEEINRYLEPIHTADIQFEPFTQMTKCARHFAEWGYLRAAEKYNEIEYNRQRAEESDLQDAEVVFSGHALHTDVTKWADGYKLKIRIYDDN